jgi:hypothetical protein
MFVVESNYEYTIIPRTMAIAEPQGLATARLILPELSRISTRKVGHEERG